MSKNTDILTEQSLKELIGGIDFDKGFVKVPFDAAPIVIENIELENEQEMNKVRVLFKANKSLKQPENTLLLFIALKKIYPDMPIIKKNFLEDIIEKLAKKEKVKPEEIKDKYEKIIESYNFEIKGEIEEDLFNMDIEDIPFDEASVPDQDEVPFYDTDIPFNEANIPDQDEVPFYDTDMPFDEANIPDQEDVPFDEANIPDQDEVPFYDTDMPFDEANIPDQDEVPFDETNISDQEDNLSEEDLEVPIFYQGEEETEVFLANIEDENLSNSDKINMIFTYKEMINRLKTPGSENSKEIYSIIENLIESLDNMNDREYLLELFEEMNPGLAEEVILSRDLPMRNIYNISEGEVEEAVNNAREKFTNKNRNDSSNINTPKG